MKMIIDRKRYDTETARELGYCDYGGGAGDFGHWYETLYLSPGGMFFTVGAGGPSSKYAVSAGRGDGSWSGSDNNFRVLDQDDAYSWLEREGLTEIIEELFLVEIEEA